MSIKSQVCADAHKSGQRRMYLIDGKESETVVSEIRYGIRNPKKSVFDHNWCSIVHLSNKAQDGAGGSPMRMRLIMQWYGMIIIRICEIPSEAGCGGFSGGHKDNRTA